MTRPPWLFWQQQAPLGSCGGWAQLLFTSRHGGHSAAPFESFNLGAHVGDDPAAVSRNRDNLAGFLGVEPPKVVFANQIHSATVVEVHSPWSDSPADADALITKTPGLALGVMVADCLPVLLWSPQGWVAAIHAGRQGMDSNVVSATCEALAKRDVRTVHAVLGPSICGRCYEVPTAMQSDIVRRHPGAFATTAAGTAGIDLVGAVRGQLEVINDQGLLQVASVDHVDQCTAEQDSWFSYRRDGVTGRFAGVVMVGAKASTLDAPST